MTHILRAETIKEVLQKFEQLPQWRKDWARNHFGRNKMRGNPTPQIVEAASELERRGGFALCADSSI